MRGVPVSYIWEMKMLTKCWLENLNLRIRRRYEDNIEINLIFYDGSLENELFWPYIWTSGDLL